MTLTAETTTPDLSSRGDPVRPEWATAKPFDVDRVRDVVHSVYWQSPVRKVAELDVRLMGSHSAVPGGWIWDGEPTVWLDESELTLSQATKLAHVLTETVRQAG